ncbi:uncharacterized protein Fot_24570 [Forsythia ovata]|uniref:Uncharacterized protein n=1 Tax=Forsythia ovata TaxID=205694 RepID=A0ABD1U6M4_9LAMI
MRRKRRREKDNKPFAECRKLKMFKGERQTQSTIQNDDKINHLINKLTRNTNPQTFSIQELIQIQMSNTSEPDSLDFLSGKRSHASKGSHEEVAHNSDLSAEALPMQEDEFTTSSENLDAEPIDDTQDVETSQVSEVAQEKDNTVRGLCNFDMNQEVCLEDIDSHGNQISTTVSSPIGFFFIQGTVQKKKVKKEFCVCVYNIGISIIGGVCTLFKE